MKLRIIVKAEICCIKQMLAVFYVMLVQPRTDGKPAELCRLHSLDDILQNGTFLGLSANALRCKEINIGVALAALHLLGGGKKVKAVIHPVAL